jgi:molecular chaperone DnaK
LIFQSEKMLKENGDKVPAEAKTDVESALTEAKSKLDSEDKDVLTAAREALEKKFHKMAEELYKNVGAQGADAQAGASAGQGPKSSKDDVVDAEYEEGSPN